MSGSLQPNYRKLIEDFFREVWNERNDEAISHYMADDLVEHGLAELTQITLDRNDFFEFRRSILNAFPDVRFEVLDVLSDGEYCAIRFTVDGTHQGEGLGFPATGKTISISGLGIGRIRNSQIVEAWNCFDKLRMLRQLGVIQE